eukprot:TRINITY_DN1649_c1_g1_i7.p4 TRINITY_DN1649_c1_g1~~TRINITY_DN1649_c1_g1_i7.p4  ORF type:complete len:186 (-),score=-21.52 TRINITY_DN1649_c1_g1_i7:1030-1587(-)
MRAFYSILQSDSIRYLCQGEISFMLLRFSVLKQIVLNTVLMLEYLIRYYLHKICILLQQIKFFHLYIKLFWIFVKNNLMVKCPVLNYVHWLNVHFHITNNAKQIQCLVLNFYLDVLSTNCQQQFFLQNQSMYILRTLFYQLINLVLQIYKYLIDFSNCIYNILIVVMFEECFFFKGIYIRHTCTV